MIHKPKKNLIDYADFKNHSLTLQRILFSKWFSENGTIAFEHGYPKYTFQMYGEKYVVDMISIKGIHCHNINSKQRMIRSFYQLTSVQITNLINHINNYYQYCLTEA